MVQVPNSAQYTVEEYLTEREMSSLPVLLVEGEADSVIFQLIIDEVIQYESCPDSELRNLLHKMHIDTASLISSPPESALGNKEKVEYVCLVADENDYSSFLVGFSDREFRRFNVEGAIYDDLECHNRIGRLLWSRGHSVENYLFDWSILRDCLRDYAVSSKYPVNEALDLFRANLDTFLQYGVAISLAAEEHELIKIAGASLGPEIFRFSGQNVVIDIDIWDGLMKKRQGQKLDEERRQKLILGFNSYNTIAELTEHTVKRWVCHGHIGMSVLWCGFQACVWSIARTHNVKITGNLMTLPNEKDRLKAFSSSWIKRMLPSWFNGNPSPLNCFDPMRVAQSTG